ncbi:MAG: thiol peroxidase [Candidatus Omnitrophota bacterium]|nr:MAG: thiol peroxidase [Candidatus Omnitrophota bacterium]
MRGKVLFKGKALTLVGRLLQNEEPAPGFRVVSGDLKEVTLSDFEGKIKIITTFPSLDTPVCYAQAKEFNNRASGVSDEVIILGISKDLPFAQKRFCESYNINKIVTLSDYKFSSFGINYGLLIKELNLLARSILIIDRNNVIRYIQIVEELTQQPDYDDALKHLEDVLKNPTFQIAKNIPSQCKPCEEGTPPLSKETVEKLLAQYRGWELLEDKKIKKEFKCKDFIEAKYLLDLISLIAEEQGHHPLMTLVYNKLRIILSTHAAGGLTENDFIMARIIDEVTTIGKEGEK